MGLVLDVMPIKIGENITMVETTDKEGTGGTNPTPKHITTRVATWLILPLEDSDWFKTPALCSLCGTFC